MQMKKTLEMEKKKEEDKSRKLKMERAKMYDEDEIEGVLEDESRKDAMELYCVFFCSNKFKSDKQWKNHREKVAEFKDTLEEEEDEEGEEIDDANESNADFGPSVVDNVVDTEQTIPNSIGSDVQCMEGSPNEYDMSHVPEEVDTDNKGNTVLDKTPKVTNQPVRKKDAGKGDTKSKLKTTGIMTTSRMILEQWCFEDEIFMMLMLLVILWFKRNGVLRPRQSLCTSNISGAKYVHELLTGSPTVMYQLCRMDTYVFNMLCSHMQERGYLSDRKHIKVEEKVCMFLQTIGHNVSNCRLKHRFQHSGHTISKFLHEVLRAMIKFAKEMILPPAFEKPMPPVRSHRRLREGPFKGAIGAIDGTLISAVVPKEKRIPFRGRGGKECFQNVMGVCDFDMKFTYVIAGWEGSADDSRILSETVRKPESLFPLPPPDKYYLCDLAYTHTRGFMVPYRNQRYWLSSWRSGPAVSKEELFNRTHARLRNVIERTFGVLKCRFRILSDMPSYIYRTQVSLVVACMAIHNYLRRYFLNDDLFEQYGDDIDAEVDNNIPMDFDNPMTQTEVFRPHDQAAMVALRDQIANEFAQGV